MSFYVPRHTCMQKSLGNPGQTRAAALSAIIDSHHTCFVATSILDAGKPAHARVMC